MPRIVLENPTLSSAERDLVVSALEKTGSIVEAAQLLGVPRRTVTRLIAKHGIAWPKPAEPVVH